MPLPSVARTQLSLMTFPPTGGVRSISRLAEHKHWHGATPHEGMTHIAIQESVNGSPVTWMEKVTDDEYLAPLAKD